jgi:hypothetical protein
LQTLPGYLVGLNTVKAVGLARFRVPEKVQVPPKFCGEKLVVLTVRARAPNLTVWAPISIEVMFVSSNRFCSFDVNQSAIRRP